MKPLGNVILNSTNNKKFYMFKKTVNIATRNSQFIMKLRYFDLGS